MCVSFGNQVTTKLSNEAPSPILALLYRKRTTRSLECFRSHENRGFSSDYSYHLSETTLPGSAWTVRLKECCVRLLKDLSNLLFMAPVQKARSTVK